ncbi:hypothetical protein GCM10009665_21660 [Kitasatospora nipponensis]|uniref:Uncharacterized protein n=1 Tax=Kitasatospora nipponensis TaxID=258049 RepID=A0ABP4GN91_9ACTN
MRAPRRNHPLRRPPLRRPPHHHDLPAYLAALATLLLLTRAGHASAQTVTAEGGALAIMYAAWRGKGPRPPAVQARR